MLEVDFQSWRRKNLSRPPQELIREAIQNVLDENPTNFALRIKTVPGGKISLEVEDDCPGGIRDLSTTWTLYKTDKRSDPTNRGRMGRGLKEIIVVGDRATVVSEKGTVKFNLLKEKKQFSPENKRERGTLISMQISEWPISCIEEIEDWCRFIIVPEGVIFKVNDQEIPHREMLEDYDEINLKTVIYDEGLREHEKLRVTTVELYEKVREEAYIYEMNIPVDVLPDYPYDVNILQRIPVPPERNHIRETYKRSLYKQLLELRAHKLTKEEVTADYVGQVIGESAPDVQDEIIKKRFGANTVIGSNLDHHQSIAIPEKGARLVMTGHLSKGWREAFKKRRPTAKKFMQETMEGDIDWFGKQQDSSWSPKVTPYEDLSNRDRKVVDFTKWFAENLEPKYSWRIEVVENTYPGGRLADCGKEMLNSFLIRLFRKPLNKYCDFFIGSPFTAGGLGIIIHEVSHVSPYKHTQEQYRYIEKMAGKASQIMLLQAAEIKRMFKKIMP